MEFKKNARNNRKNVYVQRLRTIFLFRNLFSLQLFLNMEDFACLHKNQQ